MPSLNDGTKADLIRRPSSLRTGIFWILGSVDESRPVNVNDCLKIVWTLPSLGSISARSPTT